MVPPVPPSETLPNDINCDSRPLDSMGEVPPATALPVAWSVDDSAENVVAAVPADALPCPDCEAACAARNAAICAQRSFWPDIELTILVLLDVTGDHA